MRSLIAALVVGTLAIFCTAARAQSLAGSRGSVARQAEQAATHDYSYMETGTRVVRFADAGLLMRVDGDSNYDLHGVSYPYSRPAVKLFIERLAAQFRSGCGEKLTVTSLTRPITEQPPNSSKDSVHPTGMAIDLRVPATRACRDWLNQVLLSLEGTGTLEATRENSPPHYHIAVFPNPYEQYVASLGTTVEEYIVQRGDSLWTIAEKTGASVPLLRASNRIDGDLIRVGQKLTVPAPADLPVQAEETIHRVQRGDSLSAIARLYGTSVAAITAANGLSDDLIRVGQTLRVVPR